MSCITFPLSTLHAKGHMTVMWPYTFFWYMELGILEIYVHPPVHPQVAAGLSIPSPDLLCSPTLGLSALHLRPDGTSPPWGYGCKRRKIFEPSWVKRKVKTGSDIWVQVRMALVEYALKLIGIFLVCGCGESLHYHAVAVVIGRVVLSLFNLKL